MISSNDIHAVRQERCDKCGGLASWDSAARRLTCAACGAPREVAPAQASFGDHALFDALASRKLRGTLGDAAARQVGRCCSASAEGARIARGSWRVTMAPKQQFLTHGVIGALSWLALASCYGNEDSRLCTTSMDCKTGSSCIVAPVSTLSFCADPSAGCPTGLRWADSAGDELSGTCVGPGVTIDAGMEE
jgi:hypothetical protein